MEKGGFWSLYAGFGVSVIGIIAYRGPYFGEAPHEPRSFSDPL